MTRRNREPAPPEAHNGATATAARRQLFADGPPAPIRGTPASEESARQIKRAIIGVPRGRTARGPDKAFTVIAGGLVVVTLGDCLTTAERTLAALPVLVLDRPARQ